jgi:hypothetical protein
MLVGLSPSFHLNHCISSFMAFGSRWISLANHSCSSFALVVSPVCRWGSSPSFRRCWRGLSVDGPDRWGLGSLLGLTSIYRLRKASFSRVRRMGLTWEWTLRPYKDYSSLLKWQANLFVPLCNYGFVSAKVCGDFWSVNLIFLFIRLFWLSVALVEILGLCILLFCLWRFWLFVSSL